MIMAAWHETHSTGYQGYHTGGEVHHYLYAIVIDGKVVYRPLEDPEISAAIPASAGDVFPDLLCTLND
ncbi:MAG: hypothetical protein WCE79_25005 [Xanthobacteraceae bacterium]